MAFTDRAAEYIHRQVLELGYRHDPAVQSHYFARPAGSEGQMGGLVMRWTPLGDGEVVADVQVPDISGLSLAQKSDLLKQLKRDGFGGPHVPPPTDTAVVVESIIPGEVFTDGVKVREVSEVQGEWVKVVDPETDRTSRMKVATLEGWERA